MCLFFTHEAAGASSARHSLRPLLSRGANGSCKTSGASRRGIAESHLKIVVVSAQACGLKQAQGGDMTGDQFAALLDEFTRSARLTSVRQRTAKSCGSDAPMLVSSLR